MEPIKTISRSRSATSTAADVDTDQIIPKQFLKRIERTGLRRVPLLSTGPRSRAGTCRRNPILTAGRNFGCGSSREHAPWALEDYGFRADRRAELRRHLLQQLRPRSGCCRSCSTEADVRALAAAGEGEIDLEAQEVRFAGRSVPFEIDAEIRRRLLGGLDDIALTLQGGRRDRRLRGRPRAPRAGDQHAVKPRRDCSAARAERPQLGL